MSISTTRLEMRRMKLADAEVITKLANYPKIAETTMRMPYPSQFTYIKNWIEKDIQAGGEDSGSFVKRNKRNNWRYWVRG